MRRLWDRISSSRPFTWQGYAWLSLGLLLFGPSVLRLSSVQDPAVWRRLLLLTLTLEGLVILSCRTIMGRRRIADAPVLALSTLVIASLAFPVILKVLLNAFLGPDAFNPGAFRYFTAGIIWFLGTLIFAVTVNETEAFRKELAQLRIQLDKATQLEQDEKKTLETLRSNILAEITNTLRESFRAVARIESSVMVERQLQDLITSVIRPLSVKLNGRELQEPSAEQELNLSGGRIKISAVVSKLADSNPFNYKVMPMAVALSTFSMKTWVASLQVSLLSLVVSTTLVWMFMFGLHRAHEKFVSEPKQQLTVFSILGVFLAVALADTVVANLVLQIAPSPFSFLLVFIEFGVMVLLALLHALPLERRRLLAETNDAIAHVGWMNSRLGQLIRIEQNRISRLVHGDIQARIVATIMSFNLRPIGSDMAHAQLVELQESCEKALLSPVQVVPIKSFIESMQTLWQDSLDIRTQIADGVVELVEGDVVAKEAVMEIVRESIINAVKHSGATRVDICIGIQTPSQLMPPGISSSLTITITSNRKIGQVGEFEAPRGFEEKNSGRGSEFFSQLSTSWTLNVTENESEVHAVVPLKIISAVKG